MGTIIGVIVGYSLGTRAGQDGWDELLESWKVITSSDEVRDLIGGGLSLAKELLGRGGAILAGSLGTGEAASRLRRVA